MQEKIFQVNQDVANGATGRTVFCCSKDKNSQDGLSTAVLRAIAVHQPHDEPGEQKRRM